MLQGLRNMTDWGIPLTDSVQMATTNPARIYSMKKVGSIIPEYRADLTILDDKLQLKALFIGGKLIRDRFA
jgi:N-acetylglucosamine-6-phosphate deacetylase